MWSCNFFNVGTPPLPSPHRTKPGRHRSVFPHSDTILYLFVGTSLFLSTNPASLFFRVYSRANTPTTYLTPPPRYGTKIPPATLAARISTYVHYFTLHGALRPFGASTLVAAYDPGTGKHSLHMVEPSGVSYEYYGAAAGRGRQPARTEMEKLSINPAKVVEGGNLITVSEGVRQLAKIVHALHDGAKDKPFELEMSWLCEGSGWKHEGVPRDVISEAVEWAKKEIDEDADGDDDDDDDDEEGGGDDEEDDGMEE